MHVASNGRPRRAATRVACLAIGILFATVPVLASLEGGASPAADGATVSGDQAQIAQITNQIAADGALIEHLSNLYDEKLSQHQADQLALEKAKAQLARSVASERRSLLRLRQVAIAAYVSGGSSGSPLDALLQKNVNSLASEGEYVDVAGDQLQGAAISYQQAAIATTRQEHTLQRDAAVTEASLVALRSDAAAAQSDTEKEHQLLGSVKGNLAGLLARAHAEQVAREEAAARRAEAVRAAEQQAAAQQAAAASAQRAVAEQVTAPPAGSASTPGAPVSPIASPPASSAASSGQAQVAVRAALAQVGTPYVWGGATPGVGFDCSGLVMYAWGVAGVSLPHYTVYQYDDTTQVSASQLQPGDLVFYDSPYDGPLGHVAMYIGGGQVVQAPETGMDVMVTSLTWAGQPVAFTQP